MSADISHRINQLIKHFGLNITSFSKAIGISNNVTIGRIIKENRGPSFDVLEKILLKFDSISPEWLIIGKEPMLKKDIHHLPSEAEMDRLADVEKILVDQIRENYLLKNENEKLKKEIAALKSEK